MNVTVTGAGGFLASHLIPRLLEGGHQVTGVDILNPGSRESWRLDPFRSHQRFTYLWRSVEDLPFAFTDAILHLAAVTDVNFGRHSPLFTLQQNVQATLKLLWLAANQQPGPPHLIYISTHSVYGPNHLQPIPEDVPLRPATFYGASKAMAEMMVRAVCQESRPEIPYTIIRPSLMYGERERPGALASLFLGLAFGNKPIRLEGGGQQTRDMTYVSNVVDLLALALEDSRSHGQTYNAGSGQEIPIHLLAERAMIAANREPVGSLVITDARPGEEGRLLLDSSKATRELGWSPVVPFEQGFHRLIKEFSKR